MTGKAWAYHGVAAAQAKAGFLADALVTARAIEDPYVKTQTLCDLVTMRAESGDRSHPVNPKLNDLFSRRSIRAYTPEPIDDGAVRDILEAAMAAPSAVAKDPWAFVVVRDRDTLAGIADGLPNGKMLNHAPLGVVVCGDLRRAHDGQLSYLLARLRRRDRESASGRQHVGPGGVLAGRASPRGADDAPSHAPGHPRRRASHRRRCDRPAGGDSRAPNPLPPGRGPSPAVVAPAGKSRAACHSLRPPEPRQEQDQQDEDLEPAEEHHPAQGDLAGPMEAGVVPRLADDAQPGADAVERCRHRGWRSRSACRRTAGPPRSTCSRARRPPGTATPSRTRSETPRNRRARPCADRARASPDRRAARGGRRSGETLAPSRARES